MQKYRNLYQGSFWHQASDRKSAKGVDVKHNCIHPNLEQPTISSYPNDKTIILGVLLCIILFPLWLHILSMIIFVSLLIFKYNLFIIFSTVFFIYLPISLIPPSILGLIIMCGIGWLETHNVTVQNDNQIF